MKPSKRKTFQALHMELATSMAMAKTNCKRTVRHTRKFTIDISMGFEKESWYSNSKLA